MTPTDDLITLGEAAAMLTVSKSTVLRLEQSGRLPSVRPTERIVRFRRSAVEALLSPTAS